MTDKAMNTLAKLTALAVSATGKFGKAEHEAVLAKLFSAGLTPDEIQWACGRIGNVSAVRQELEKAGLLKNEVSSFAQAVREASKAIKP